MKDRTINDVFYSLLGDYLKMSLLDSYLDEHCDDIQKIILSSNIKSWLPGKDPDNTNKDFFNLSKGHLFERYIVQIMDQKQWTFISWRGDKIIEKSKSKPQLKPQTNSYPDLTFKYNLDKKTKNGFSKGDRLAIECKWTNDSNNRKITFEKCAYDILKQKGKDCYYPINALKDYASCFYFAIGVGWNNRNKPKAVYFIPANTIRTISDAKELENYKLRRKPLLNKKDSLISSLKFSEDEKKTIRDFLNFAEAYLKGLKEKLL